LQQQISSITDSTGLPLRKSCSNSSTIRASLSNLSEDPLFALEIQREDAVKSLETLIELPNVSFYPNFVSARVTYPRIR